MTPKQKLCIVYFAMYSHSLLRAPKSKCERSNTVLYTKSFCIYRLQRGGVGTIFFSFSDKVYTILHISKRYNSGRSRQVYVFLLWGGRFTINCTIHVHLVILCRNWTKKDSILYVKKAEPIIMIKYENRHVRNNLTPLTGKRICICQKIINRNV